MKVIYCEFHQGLARNSESRCDWSMARGDDFYGGAPCRMVPMRLIPDDALMAAEYLEQERNDDLRRALGKGRYAPWERDIERLLNRGDAILAVLDGGTP